MIATMSDKPNQFLDLIINKLELKNDAQLAKKLAVAPPVISKIRNKKSRVGDSIILRAYEASGLAIESLRDAAGIKTFLTGVANVTLKVTND